MALKVVCVVDKVGTALWRLAKGVEPFHQNLDYVVLACHPKRPSPEQLEAIERECKSADIIDYQYFRTAEMLREKYDWLKKIPSILTHNNAYSHKEGTWNDYQVNVGNNRTIYDDLQKITTSRVEYITLAVDPYFWKFNDNYEPKKSVIMVANRIESKKGILPVALACKKLGIRMNLIGNISDMTYFREINDTGVVEYGQNVSDEMLREMYYKSGIHVCNSVDNYESGTLPILEAMFCGVPVLTRSVGHVPDFADESNIVINKGEPDDVENLVKLISEMFYEPNKLEKQRQEAWFAIKDKIYERRAYSYQKLYRELLEGQPVSVIVPIAGREDVTRQCLNAISGQTHKNLEIIVVDDGEVKQEEVIKQFSKTVSIPVRYMETDGIGYNLAKARNMGIIEATSDILVFCDQRMIMQEDAVEKFLAEIQPKYWLFGNKGANKREFVENFSCAYRSDIITMGMFNERCDRYGSMSQEVRARARRQEILLHYLDNVHATPAGKSGNRTRKKYEIMQSKTMLWKAGLL